MSSILREVVGSDQFHGAKWPQDAKIARFKKTADEVDRYVRDKQEPGWDSEAYKDLNPNGFWECPWTVRGVQRYDQCPGPLEGAKVVSQGLGHSNPEAISRVVYMVRDPRAVAKSQERLKRQFVPDGTVHSPEMYIKVHTAAAAWIMQHQPDLRVVEFDDLLEDPVAVLSGLDEWTSGAGFPGRFADQATEIRQRLRHSADQKTPEQSEADDSWEDAEEIYQLLQGGDFAGIVGRDRKKPDPHRRYFCTRLGTQVPAAMCRFCWEDETTRQNFKRTAKQRGIDWRTEPCIYECKERGMGIVDSIAANHWMQ